MLAWVSVVTLLVMLGPAGLQGVTATPDASAPSCRSADVLYSAERYEDAQQRYLDLLDADPDLTCAEVGLRLSQASTFIADGNEDGAREQYEEARALDSSLPGFDAWRPVERPTATAPPEADFSGPKALDDAGFDAEAREALADIVSTYPTATIPPSLLHLVDPNVGSGKWLLDLRDSFSSQWNRWNWLVGVVALATVIFLIGRKVIARLRNRHKAYIDIEPFDKGVIGLDLGTTIEFLVGAHYARLENRDTASGPKFVLSAPPQDTGLDAIVALVPDPTGTIGKLVKAIGSVGRDHRTLKGLLTHDLARGAGLQVTLNGGAQGIEHGEIWENDIVTPWHLDEGTASSPEDVTAQQFTDLAEAVAIWLWFTLKVKEPA